MMKSYTKSHELYQRAKLSLAGGVSSQFRLSERPHPLFYEKAEGARIWDVDGNEYLDFTLSQGPMILGHSHPAVLQAVRSAIAQGQLYAAQHVAELELAETLTRVIPCAELVRFSLTGSEAVQAALRLARAYTGKQRFIKFEGHYHGWFDNVAFSISPSRLEAGPPGSPCPVPWTEGIPPEAKDDVIVLPWNCLDLLCDALRKHASETAAIITEPVMCNNGCVPPEPGFLEQLREACTEYGILLIFDEIITGFRLAIGGAQSYFNVVPDLALLGKAMANGFPISAVVGRREIMELFANGRCIHAGTMNAHNASVAAALATIDELNGNSVTLYPRLFQLGEDLRSGLKDAAETIGHEVLIQGIGPVFHVGFTSAKCVSDYRGTLSYDQQKYVRFCDIMREHGVRLIGRGLWYVSAAHAQGDIEQCLRAAREAFEQMR